MTATKKQHEGYLLIDNRSAGEGMFEAATLTCSHCQQQLIRNPSRIRDRGYCPKCDHYVCDACEAHRSRTGECLPFAAIIDMVQEKAIRGENTSDIHKLIARL